MSEGLKYSYDELIKNSVEINKFTQVFDGQIGDLIETASAMSSNYQSEEAEKIIKAINTVSEDAADFKEAISAFATKIEIEIAPTYKAIEEKASASAEGVYGNQG